MAFSLYGKERKTGVSVRARALPCGTWIYFYGWRCVTDVHNLPDPSRVLICTNRGEFEVRRDHFIITEKTEG